MRILVAAVGRFGTGSGKAGAERALFDEYVRRMTTPVSLKEIEEKRPLTPEALMKSEAEKLSAAIPKGAVTVALDAGGKQLGSEDLARQFQHWFNQGVKDVAFVIGGAEGLDPSVTAQASLRLSLGPMIWPHMLVRVMLMEQIYRAQCILSGHPYHRA
ncbi:MAG: 23S rRNA (pseudouridine(1915)-N(3))-methyltransferase RlmH [Rhodospirillales bacterium]